MITGGLLLLFLGLYAWTWFAFRRWREHAYAEAVRDARVATTGSGDIEYREQGCGPPVLFLHGAPGGCDQGLALPGYRVIIPSRPGYLGTSLSVGAGYPEMAQAMVGLLDALGIERVPVIGFSAAGPLALQLARQCPQRITALVLLSAVSVRRIEPVPSAGWLRRVGDRLFGRDFSDWVNSSLEYRFAGPLWLHGPCSFLTQQEQQRLLQEPQRLEALKRFMSTSLLWSRRRAGFADDRGRCAELPPRVEPLPRALPVLAVHGAQDNDVQLTHAEAACEAIPGARLRVISGAGHLAIVTHAAAVAEMLGEFLAGAAAGMNHETAQERR